MTEIVSYLTTKAFQTRPTDICLQGGETRHTWTDHPLIKVQAVVW